MKTNLYQEKKHQLFQNEAFLCTMKDIFSLLKVFVFLLSIFPLICIICKLLSMFNNFLVCFRYGVSAISCVFDGSQPVVEQRSVLC